MGGVDDLARFFRWFAENSAGDYAPTYRTVCNGVADDPELLSLVAAAPTEAHHPGVLLGSVRYLLDDDHPLAECYRRRSSAGVVAAFRSFVLDNREALVELMAVRRVQTNEIARSAVLAPLAREVQRRVDQPIALIDSGTSAGLNLLLDQVHIDYGHSTLGPSDSPVQLACTTLDDGPPNGPTLDIAWRVGLDRNPIDLGDPGERRWLEACVWPDHPHRLERLRAAIGLLASSRPRLVKGDAVEDLPDLLAEAPANAHPVVMTSLVAYYLDPEQREALETTLSQCERPVTWVSAEHRSVFPNLRGVRPPRSESIDIAQVGMLSFPGHGAPPNREFIGWSHNHGAWLDWPLAKPR